MIAMVCRGNPSLVDNARTARTVDSAGCTHVASFFGVAGITMGHMPIRTPEAQKVLDELDAELAASSKRLGRSLSWTASEHEHRQMIGSTIDRRVRLAKLYAATDPDNVKDLTRLSCEIRQCDALVSRLLSR